MSLVTFPRWNRITVVCNKRFKSTLNAMFRPRHELRNRWAAQALALARRITIVSAILLFQNVSAQEPFECGTALPGTVLTMAGSWVVRPIAELWKTSYLQSCPDAGVLNIEPSGNDDAIYRLCAAAGVPSVDIAMLSRPVRATEAEAQSDGTTYSCNVGDTRREFVQLDVALDGLAITTLRGSPTDDCIQQLGGLSRDQLRWIFSSYSDNELLATGLDANSIPNSDGDPSTRHWCELLDHPSCVCREILIAGSPDGTQPHQYFGQFTFAEFDKGETFDQTKYFSSASDFDVIQYLDDTGDAIAYFRVPVYNSNNMVLSSAPILADNGIFVPPNGSTLQTGDYPYSRRVFMNVIVSDASSYRASQPFIRFGYSPLGLALVSSTGLVPIPEDEVPELLSRVSAPPLLCFSGQNTVVVKGKGTISMANLKLDDYVLANHNSYSKVVSFGHYLPDGVGEYLQIQTQSSQIEISPFHLLSVNGSLHPALHVKVGDVLGHDRVVSMTTVSSRGIYAPITESGFIAVSGVVSSSYVQLWDMDPSLMHTISHWALAPIRACKQLSLPLCSSESYNEIGIAKQYVFTLKWILQTTTSGSTVPTILSVASLPFLFIARLLEVFVSMQQSQFAAAVVSHQFYV